MPDNADLALQKVSADKTDQTVRFRVLFSFDKWHEIDFESIKHQQTPSDQTINNEPVDGGNGKREKAEVEHERVFNSLPVASLFKKKLPTTPGPGGIEHSLRDTTEGALAVGIGVGPNAETIKPIKKVMFNTLSTVSISQSNALETAKKIENLCSAIRQANEVNTDSCLGVLVREDVFAA
ncbi:hypothetical protein K440DRAFT_666046 [Wilcoxina mikolae CBS 423.85]|nr:hypothetical protein K440DRAFT_666046 [Wilcoxina mikolae CBS 423.85]